ncbi:hypothetical protein BJ742DRAFT_227919 [Cladochytrium replicatum]|nr:hypothetical protein BJ742DRAFT_227919 [Cladochytrium replicatum]
MSKLRNMFLLAPRATPFSWHCEMNTFLSGLKSKVAKAYTNLRDDAVKMDLVPALGSQGTFIVSRGEEGSGDLLICGSVILLFPEVVSFKHLRITFLGESIMRFSAGTTADESEPHTEVTTLVKEEYILMDTRTMSARRDPADPHIEDFSFQVPAHRALDLPPSARWRSGKKELEVSYKVIAELADVSPGDKTYRKEEQILWTPIVDWTGVGVPQLINDNYEDIHYRIRVPEAALLGSDFRFTFRFRNTPGEGDESAPRSTENAFIDVSERSGVAAATGTIGRRQVLMPKVKELHIHVVERVWLMPSDGRYQTVAPLERKYVVSTLMGDTLSKGWASTQHVHVQLPKWSSSISPLEQEEEVPILGRIAATNPVSPTAAVAPVLSNATATLRRTLSRKAPDDAATTSSTFVPATPTAAFVPTEPEQLVTPASGLNPSHSASRFRISHSIEIVLGFHDAMVKRHEVPIRSVVENPAFLAAQYANVGFAQEMIGIDEADGAAWAANGLMSEEDAIAHALKLSEGGNAPPESAAPPYDEDRALAQALEASKLESDPFSDKAGVDPFADSKN